MLDGAPLEAEGHGSVERKRALVGDVGEASIENAELLSLPETQNAFATRPYASQNLAYVAKPTESLTACDHQRP